MNQENNYYMIITTKEDYSCDVKNIFSCAGFPYKNRKTVSSMKKGDKIVFYVASRLSMFCAVVEIIGKPYISKTQIWSDEFLTYDYRVPTKPIVFVKNVKDGVFIKEIWDNLKIISNKKKWGSQVQGSLRIITKHDFEVIEKAIKGVVNK